MAVGAVWLQVTQYLTLTVFLSVSWLACNCRGYPCEETTGRCQCPPHTMQPQCEACEPHFYNFHPVAGCESCNCSLMGTHPSMKCDPITGQCR